MATARFGDPEEPPFLEQPIPAAVTLASPTKVAAHRNRLP
jgi:hypothetical protein